MRLMPQEIQSCVMYLKMTNLYLIETDCTNPYHNIALEEYLLDTLPVNSVILYLWQNYRTVVIGRNQSANQEVNYKQLEENGGFLARRLSGGGAVFHDLGNLNFTFIMANKDFDLDKQTDVILKAINSLGIKAIKNGRNDLTVDGHKFSGHAYYHGKENSYHHGTIMLDVNNDELVKYLNVSKKKLASKSIKSVRSRVINLKQLKPKLTIAEVKEALIKSFEEVYGNKVVRINDDVEIEDRIKRFSDPNWIYDKDEKYEFSKEQRFDWGIVNIKYNVEKMVIKDIAIYTDCLDSGALQQLPGKLKQKPLDNKLYSLTNNEYEKDVIGLLLGG